MKHVNLWLVTVFIAFGCHSTLQAVSLKPEQPQSPDTMATQKHETGSIASSYAELQKGASFQSGSNTYIFLPELYSLANNRKAAASTLAAIRAEKSAVLIGEKGRFSIFKSGLADKQAAMSLQTTQNQTLYPVVLNPDTNNLAIVVGTLKVKLKDLSQADAIAADFKLEPPRKYSHLQTAYFKLPAGQDMIALSNALRSDARVERVAIEVLEHIMVPQ